MGFSHRLQPMTGGRNHVGCWTPGHSLESWPEISLSSTALRPSVVKIWQRWARMRSCWENQPFLSSFTPSFLFFSFSFLYWLHLLPPSIEQRTCYWLNVCILPWCTHCIPKHSALIFGGRTLGQPVGHGNRVPTISLGQGPYSMGRGTPEPLYTVLQGVLWYTLFLVLSISSILPPSPSLLLCMWGHGKNTAFYEPGRGWALDNKSVHSLILGSYSLELWKITFCYLKHQVNGILL